MFPQVVKRIADFSISNGIRPQIITGGFWVRSSSKSIVALLERIGSVTFSYDRFHSEIDRSALMKQVGNLLDRNVSCAFQIVHDTKKPEFTEHFVAELEKTFGIDVPYHIAPLSPVGRAGVVNPPSTSEMFDTSMPCITATWPVISYTGNIVACCNQEAVDAVSPPPHLLLGDVASSSHADVIAQLESRAELRAVRGCGPISFVNSITRLSQNYCHSCLTFEASSRSKTAIEEIASSPLCQAVSNYLPAIAQSAAETEIGNVSKYVRQERE